MAQPTLRTVWGLAKCPELHMTDEQLHLVVQAHTGKDSMRQLTRYEIGIVAGVLISMKMSARKAERDRRRSAGNPTTENQRKKIYCLTQELGWDDPARLNGLCKRMCGVSCVEWLNYQQCSKVIEALKNMVKREKEKQEVGKG